MPGPLMADLRHVPGRVGPGYSRRFEATAVFVDVVGFTPISEALAAVGREGAEELTATLNAFFGPAIAILAEWGGSVAAFAGDAMTVVFESDGDRDSSLHHALGAALLVQDHARRNGRVDTSAGTFDLTVRAGVGLGEIVVAVVGSATRWHGYTAGTAVAAATAAEGAAHAGEVVVASGEAASLGAARLEHVGGGYARVVSLERLRPLPALAPHPSGQAGAERFVPRSVAERIRAGGDAFVEEHRRITTIFAGFEAPDPAARTAAAALQDYVGAVLDVVDRYGGCMTQVQADDKGSSFLVVFGAPGAHDDDAARAVACARAVAAIAGTPSRIGMTTGTAFCGRVGAVERRTYTVMGDCVNLAARLMQAAAPGAVLADDTTRAASGAGFSWTPPWTIQVKGKDTPVQVATSSATGPVEAAAPVPALPLVGRTTELATIGAFLDDLGSPGTNLLVVRGPSGIGKTRIVGEGADIARTQGVRVVEGRCDAYGSGTPYLPWRSAWRSLLGVSTSFDVYDLARRVPGVRDLAERAPLLSGVVGLQVEETALTSRLAPEMRSKLLQSLLVDLLVEISTSAPVVFLVEDAHWMDPASRDLLTGLARATASFPVGFVITTRVVEDTALVDSLAAGEGAIWLEVEGLDDDAARSLVRQKAATVGLAALDDGTVDQLLERTGGTPLFVEALLDLAAQTDADPAAVLRADLPEGLRSAVLARLDRLGEADKVLVKLASVVGREFPLSWLTGAFPAIGEGSDIEARVGRLGRMGFARVLAHGEPIWRFTHAAYQEVAYGAISYETRRRLHADVGMHIEAVSGEDANAHVELLAHHFGQTRDTERQRRYFALAGRKAKAAYANESALDWFERLRPLLVGDEASEVAVEAGEVRVFLGEWDLAKADFTAAAGPPRIRARAARHLGNLFTLQGDYQSALGEIGAACALAREAGDAGALMRALDALGRAQVFLADYPGARVSATEHLDLARTRGDAAETGAGLENLALVEWALGDLDAAAGHLDEALALGRSVGDLVLVAHAANDLAGVYDASGSLERCVETLTVSAEAARRVGYRHHLGVITGNEAELRLSRGDTAGALSCALSAIETLAALGDRTGVVRNLGIAGVGLAAAGRADAGEALLRRAIDAGSGETYHLAENLVALGRLVLDRGDTEGAVDVLREAVGTAQTAGNEPAEFDATLLLVRAEVDAGERSVAAALDVLDDLHGGRTEPAERAALAYEAWRLAHGRSRTEVAAAALRGAHDATPLVQHRNRYLEVTGDPLPAPPPLPDAIVLEAMPVVTDLDSYLEELTTLLAVIGI